MEADSVIKFAEQYLKVPEGKLQGQPIELLPFQKQFIHEALKPGIRTAVLSMGRKNGKTSLAAILALAYLVGPGAQRHSALGSGAHSRDQAALVYKAAERMALSAPEVAPHVRVVPSRKEIRCPALDCSYRALSADKDTNLGLSLRLVIMDELGATIDPEDEFFDTLVTSQGAYDDDEVLTIVISTQAPSDSAILSLLIDNPDSSTYVQLHSADMSLSLDDPKAWEQANPAIDVFRSRGDIAAMAKRAESMPSFRNKFENLVLNRRVSVSTPLLDRREFEACRSDLRFLPGKPVYVGVDLAESRDLAAVAYIQPQGEGARVVVHVDSYLPSHGIDQKEQVDKAPYRAWADSGELILTDGPVTQPATIAKDILAMSEAYPLAAIGYDRWRIKMLENELIKIAGPSHLLKEVGQGYMSMSPAVDLIERMVALRVLAHRSQPLLNRAVEQCVALRDPAGNRKPDKSKSTARIDPLVALLIALHTAYLQEVDMPSPWNDPDFSYQDWKS